MIQLFYCKKYNTTGDDDDDTDFSISNLLNLNLNLLIENVITKP
jgi:hypothetical protein